MDRLGIDHVGIQFELIQRQRLLHIRRRRDVIQHNRTGEPIGVVGCRRGVDVPISIERQPIGDRMNSQRLLRRRNGP